jgi:hypothetical protein
MLFGGITEILFLLALAGGGSKDLVSFVDAKDYFQARDIEVKVDKMVELAGKTPADAQASVSQLLAIRWLGDHPAEVKKAKGARETLQQIAAGKKGKDSTGFARDYAGRALAKLDGKPLPVRALPANSVRDAGLRWFPKESTIFGSYDLRLPEGVKETENTTWRKLLGGLLRPQDKQQMYKFIEGVGNIRFDRVSFAVIPDVNQESQTRLFFRFTGKGDPKRFAAFVTEQDRNMVVKEKKGARGEKITLIESPKGRGPAIALVDDTDLIIAGYAGGPRRQGDQEPSHMEVLDQALQIMAGKKTSLVKGPQAGVLKSIPARASGLVMGELPDKWRTALTGRGSPFKAFPKTFKGTLIRKANVVELKMTGSAASAKEARDFVESVETIKKMAIEGLKKMPTEIKAQGKEVKITKKTIETLQTALKGIKVEAKDALLSGEATISRQAIRAAGELIPLWFFPSPKQPPPKDG